MLHQRPILSNTKASFPKFILLSLFFLNLSFPAYATPSLTHITKYSIVYDKEKNPLSLKGVLPGAGSGLDFLTREGDELVFLTVADRATSYKKKKRRQPFFGQLHIRTALGNAKLRKIWPLKLKPNVDLEGVVLRDKALWLADESRPRLLMYSWPELKLQKKVSPGNQISGIYGTIEQNRGFEGLSATPSGEIVTIVQGPLKADKKYFKHFRFLRVLFFNPLTNKSRSFAYPISKDLGDDAVRISAVVALSDDEFVISERGTLDSGQYSNRLFRVSFRQNKPLPKKPAFKKPEVRKAFIPEKNLLLDLREHGWSATKAEGLALLPNKKTLAIISDQDQEAGEDFSEIWLLHFDQVI